MNRRRQAELSHKSGPTHQVRQTVIGVDTAALASPLRPPIPIDQR